MKVLGVTVILAIALSYAGAIDEVTFFQKPVCNGHHFTMTLGNGECKRVPEWLTLEGWNLSIDPQGHCVKVYENDSCRESVVGYGARGYSAREDIVRRCRSTKQLGFETVQSFRKVPC